MSKSKKVQTVEEFMVDHDKCVIGKKGKKYIGLRNGEFALVHSQSYAVAFADEASYKRFVELACIDDRCAEVIGRSYNLVPIQK